MTDPTFGSGRNTTPAGSWGNVSLSLGETNGDHSLTSQTTSKSPAVVGTEEGSTGLVRLLMMLVI